MLSKELFLGADSAHHYAHVWYISDQIFHHARLPLRVHLIESGQALTFPYAFVPWLVTAMPFALIGDRAVTIMHVAGFVFYGYAATRARPALRDPRLLSLLFINTFLIEALVSFQFAFVWSVGFFFLFVAAADRSAWLWAAIWAVIAITSHPFAGTLTVAAYAAFAAVRRPRALLPLGVTMAAVTVAVAPYAWYISTAPPAGSTDDSELFETLKLMARYRGTLVVLPLVISMCAPAFRHAYLVVFAAMALTFAGRIDRQQVNTYGIDGTSQPFYGEFIASPAFDRTLQYRVLEPNDREDGAYQLLRNGARLTQDFFDESQFRRYWDSPEQYRCFLGAREVDVVLMEWDYLGKFYQNESDLLIAAEQAGDVPVLYRHPEFAAFDVRNIARPGADLDDCDL